MNGSSLKSKSARLSPLTLGTIAILLVAVAFLWLGSHTSLQSEPPMIAGVSFAGEYRIGSGEWQPIREGEHISSTKGDVTLRGYFQMHNPDTGEVLGPLYAGANISLYFNHLRATLLLPNGQSIAFDAENEHLGEDACAAFFGSYTVSDTDADGEPDNVTILLKNPHRFGNENAVDDLLENLSVAPENYLKNAMLEKCEGERNIGTVIVIASLIILGIAAFSTIIRLKYTRELWLIGLMSFFAGAYFLFDTFAVSFWNESNITNTRALGLSMMLYMLFATAIITLFLKPRVKMLAQTAVVFSGASILLCILLSFTEPIFFFDTWGGWAITELVVITILIVCQILSFKGSPPAIKFLCTVGILTLLAFPLDVVATYVGLWEGGTISKHVFLAVFTMALVVVLRVIPSQLHTAMKAKQLEAEQQALQLELQESRISIMLSQMQPHFIFNTLNTIYHLCELDPDVARKTISSFSEYLRNNIDNLGQSEMISFEKELSFVKTYLDIEKVRFDDELEITFDIEATNFKLPVLTVQPIVENAVKHGTSKKEGISRLCIATRETDACYEITVTDTGVGFDPNHYENDGHRHVGIGNVRERLKNLCGGSLLIESEIGSGTRAIIQIPKKGLKKQ